MKTLFALAESVRDCANWARQKEDKPENMVSDLERAAKIIELFDIFIKEARG